MAEASVQSVSSDNFKLEDGHVRVHIERIGCRDVHYYQQDRIGDIVFLEPVYTGQGSCGIVVEVGSKVENIKVGDRVVIEPGVPCMRCANCQYKNYNMCAGVILSTLQKYYVVPSVYCHALPASVDAEDGALVALVALALRICQVAELQARQNVLVLGSNSIGILTQMIANMQGARVIGVDTSHWRTSFASGSSAHGVCVPKWSSTSTTDSASPPPEVVDQIVHQFRLGDGADVVVDCTGSESYIKTGVFAAKRGGTYVQATVVDPFVELPIVMAQEKALNIKGSVRDIADCYPSAIDLVASGRITPRILVMNRFEADEAEEAFEEVNENREYSMKVMIKGIP